MARSAAVALLFGALACTHAFDWTSFEDFERCLVFPHPGKDKRDQPDWCEPFTSFEWEKATPRERCLHKLECSPRPSKHCAAIVCVDAREPRG